MPWLTAGRDGPDPEGPSEGFLGPEQLLTDDLLIEEEGRVRVYWLPFERLNRRARVAIIGLTPGWHQMQQAFTAARDAFHAGLCDEMAILERIRPSRRVRRQHAHEHDQDA